MEEKITKIKGVVFKYTDEDVYKYAKLPNDGRYEDIDEYIATVCGKKMTDLDILTGGKKSLTLQNSDKSPINVQKEFEVKVYKNRTNKQFVLIPMKKSLSKYITKLMDNDKVIGLKLKIVDELEKAPKAKTIINWNNNIEVREYNRLCKKYRQKGGKK